ncbi:Protein RTA1 [Fusarium culmorum]|uniref:Protein RTA1 n=1 Tax=Fusarium culmorum TaxID=5516 RepID=A0A2T4GYA1_FUSCU|nr:Protein RTA1 [Fusarium culmorum]
MNMYQRDAAADAGDAGGFKLYHYDPSMAGGAIFTLLFIGTTLFHTWQLFRADLVELVGYAARCKSANETPDWTLGPYIIQSIFLLVAPALFAATVYMELGRIVEMIDGEGRVMISKKWMTKIFVTGDILSFFLQGGGGGYQSSGTLEALDAGAKVIIVGLFVQLIFFGVFIIIAISFHRAILQNPTGRSTSGLPWKKHMMVLYIGSLFIMVRSLFRAVEYIQGNSGFLLKHEIYLYIFDALLMFLVMVLFNWFHPSEITDILDERRSGKGYSMGAFTACA